MEIAVISDIHDNVWNLQKVIDRIKGKAEAVICCGDFCAPFTTSYFLELGIPIYACLGNNDEDQIGLYKGSSGKIEWTSIGEEFGKVTIDGKNLAFCHYPKLGELLAKTGEYAAVFHGHTHYSRNENIGNTLLVNPGAVCGIQNGKPGKAFFAIYDTSDNSVRIEEI